MQEGKVKFYNETKGFGFIAQENGDEDIFVHSSGLIDNVRLNDIVTYDLEQGRRGVIAVNVRVK